MAELADALDLGSSAARRAGSSPVPGTSRCKSLQVETGKSKGIGLQLRASILRRPCETFLQTPQDNQPFAVNASSTQYVCARSGCGGRKCAGLVAIQRGEDRVHAS